MNAPKHVGWLKDESGNPVAGALISVVESSVPVPEVATRTASDGRFVLGLPSGTFRVAAHLAGRALGETSLEVPPTPQEFELRIVSVGLLLTPIDGETG